jgi:hypothetical protein
MFIFTAPSMILYLRRSVTKWGRYVDLKKKLMKTINRLQMRLELRIPLGEFCMLFATVFIARALLLKGELVDSLPACLRKYSDRKTVTGRFKTT